jgi:hypothetical protein
VGQNIITKKRQKREIRKKKKIKKIKLRNPRGAKK